MRCFWPFTLLILVSCRGSPTIPPVTYQYNIPQQTGDGWPTAHLSEVGLTESPLARMVDRIRDGSYTNIHSVLLVRSGRLVFEEYFAGRTTASNIFVEWNRERQHDMHSVTKSVTSALVGIAIDKGFIPSVNENIAGFFPEYADILGEGPKARMTLRHLLTMTAGLEWDEHTYPYSDARNSHSQMNQADNQVAFTLRLPVLAEPGQTFRYNSGLSIVLGEIVNRASGLGVDEFAEEFLFGPLGIQDYSWWAYPDGTIQTGGGLALRPRDIARVGQLFLNEGMWGGEQILSEDWVRESMTWQTSQSDPQELYGYHWWIIRLPRHDNVFDLTDQVLEGTAAVGRGGQWVFVYPIFDLVAVFTGGNDNELANQPLDIFRRFLYPALHQ